MVRAWEIDFDARRMRTEFLDGRTVEESMGTEPPSGSVIRRSRVDLELRVLTLSLDDGHVLEVELGRPEAEATSPAIPVVYLDQLHWVSLAQQLWAPARLRAAERSAAETLIQLARQRRIVLPVAGAHLTEMAPVAGHRRRDLAVTILELCRGWQMRSPMRIRTEEYAASLLAREPVARRVFTLEPGVLFADGPAPPAPLAGAPDDLADVYARVVAVSAVYSTMLDDNPLDMGEGRAAAAGWAASFPGLATYMRDHGMSAEDARINARARFMADQRQDLARAAVSVAADPQLFSSWLTKRLPAELDRMPYAGRLAEVLYHRLRNADDRWEANDLNDMNFLCAAAGYATIVIGERKTSEYLRRAESRMGSGAVVCRRLSEAVDELAVLGVRPS